MHLIRIRETKEIQEQFYLNRLSDQKEFYTMHIQDLRQYISFLYLIEKIKVLSQLKE